MMMTEDDDDDDDDDDSRCLLLESCHITSIRSYLIHIAYSSIIQYHYILCILSPQLYDLILSYLSYSISPGASFYKPTAQPSQSKNVCFKWGGGSLKTQYIFKLQCCQYWIMMFYYKHNKSLNDILLHDDICCFKTLLQWLPKCSQHIKNQSKHTLVSVALHR